MKEPTHLRRPFEINDADLPITHRIKGDFSAVEPVLALCFGGRLYEVEAWISDGRPIQFPPQTDRKLLRQSTPLHIAVSRGFHSLAAVLLANGYDPNGDYYENLTPAVTARDHDMVNLLLRFGADPNSVDFCTVLETCDRALMDRFIAAGADPCRDNAVARALYFKYRPILGFIKQYREQFPCLQRQIDIALHADTERGNSRGIALMLWLGADPHADTPSSPYDEEDSGVGRSAFEQALWLHSPETMRAFLKMPIPHDNVQRLLCRASYHCVPDVVQRLLEEGADPNFIDEDGHPVLCGFFTALIWALGPRSADETQQGLEALDIILAAGAKWTPDERQLRSFRRKLRKMAPSAARGVIELLRKHQGLKPDLLHELTRTPAIQKLIKYGK